MSAVDDETEMPFGKHKGTPIGEVPASYLLWWFNENPQHNAALFAYIEKNLKTLEAEAKREK